MSITIRVLTRIFTSVAFASALLAGLASCGEPPQRGHPATAATTGCLAPPAQAQTAKPVIAVLGEITRTGQSPPPATRLEAIGRITDAGFDMGARLLIEVIGGGPGDATLAVNTQLDSEGSNALARKTAASCKRDGVAHAVSRLTQRTSSQPLNVLDALRRLRQHTTGLTNKRVTVVMFSSMLNATAPLELNNPAVLARDPSALVDDVEHAGLLPDCRGWDVYVIGAGRTATGGISDQAGFQLQRFWTTFFTRCGGRIVVYDSELTQFPVSATRSQAKAEPAAFRFEPPTTQAPPRPVRTVTLTVASTLLFDNGSAALSPSAEAALTQVLRQIRLGRINDGVSVRGYTDTSPNNRPRGNLGLSEDRAQAVVDWLTGQGIDPSHVEAIGLGPSDPVADNNTAEGRARNRRVTITFTTTSTP